VDEIVGDVLIEAWRRAHRLRGFARHLDDYRVAALTGTPEDHLHARKTDMHLRDQQQRPAGLDWLIQRLYVTGSHPLCSAKNVMRAACPLRRVRKEQM
jgi:hypothetical protein